MTPTEEVPTAIFTMQHTMKMSTDMGAITIANERSFAKSKIALPRAAS